MLYYWASLVELPIGLLRALCIKNDGHSRAQMNKRRPLIISNFNLLQVCKVNYLFIIVFFFLRPLGSTGKSLQDYFVFSFFLVPLSCLIKATICHKTV